MLRLLVFLLSVHVSAPAFTVNYPTLEDCDSHTDTVLMLHTDSALPAPGICESFSNTCVEIEETGRYSASI